MSTPLRLISIVLPSRKVALPKTEKTPMGVLTPES